MFHSAFLMNTYMYVQVKDLFVAFSPNELIMFVFQVHKLYKRAVQKLPLMFTLWKDVKLTSLVSSVFKNSFINETLAWIGSIL